jgi:hypothetical protein
MHGCVASAVSIDPGWTREECTNMFSRLFPVAFEFHCDVQTSWFVLSKEYKTLKIVPKTSATGTDLAKYKIPKTAHTGVCLFIGKPPIE